MKRVLVLLSTVVIALVASGASGDKSQTPPAGQPQAEVIHRNTAPPDLAPAVKPQAVTAEPRLESEVPAAQTDAAAYQLNWYSINGGGATQASSTNYKMGLSVGQSVAGAATGTNYKMGIGFWYGAATGGSCLITLAGDVNNNGSITTADIIALVNYVLKSGLPPVPCIAAGDINCSGTTTTADIIALVNFVLKSGLPPCDICTNSPLAASCI